MKLFDNSPPISLTTVAVTAWMTSILALTAAEAGPEPALKCQAKKIMHAGELSLCRLKADAKAIKKNVNSDYTKCDSTFQSKWQKEDQKAGAGVCPREADEFPVNANVAELSYQILDKNYFF